MSTLHRVASKPRGRENRVLTPLSPAPQTTAERRDHLRKEADYWVSLLSLDGAEIFRNRTDNLGEGGLHVTAPVGYGFAVGQRYEVLVGAEESHDGQTDLVGEGHYATVVRTKFLTGEGQHGDGHVGIGLRFDHPVVL